MTAIYKRWEDLIPCPYVLGDNGTRDRYYKRCKEHNEVLRKHGFKSTPPPIIVSKEECDYCRLENDIIENGQIREVCLYKDGRTIKGSEGNHRAFIIGACLNKEIRCIITDIDIPETKSEWFNEITVDDMTKKMDFETIVFWIKELFLKVPLPNLAKKAFRYRSCTLEKKIKDVIYIYEKVIPFLDKHPEFKGVVGRPGEYIYSSSQQHRLNDRIFLTFGNLKHIIDNPQTKERSELSKILKSETTFLTKDQKIIKIKKDYKKDALIPPFDPYKINQLEKLLVKNSPIKNPEPLMAIDLFAREMNEFSTTGSFLSLGYEVIAIGDEVDRFMMNHPETLKPIKTEIYKYLYKYGESLPRVDWINIDPYGFFPLNCVLDLMMITSNLTWIIPHWDRWHSRAVTPRKLLEEFGLNAPKTFPDYINTLTNKISQFGYEVEERTLSKGNTLLYISNHTLESKVNEK